MMRLSQLVLLGGVAAVALTGAARAESADAHTVTIRLPGGQVEQIRYTGDVPPVISIVPDAGPAITLMGASEMAPSAMLADPFVIMRRISAEMDRQMAVMMREIDAMQAGPSGAMPMAVAAPGACVRSVQVTYTGAGQPRVVARSSGDCGAQPHASSPVAVPAVPDPQRAPHAIQVKAARPYETMVHPVSLQVR